MNDLREKLVKLGVDEASATAVVETWPAADAEAWLAGARQIAYAALVEQKPRPPAPLCEPWKTVHDELHKANGVAPSAAVWDIIGEHWADMRVQLGLGDVLHLLVGEAQKLYAGSQAGKKLSPGQVSRLGTIALEAPDPDLALRIRGILTQSGLNGYERHRQVEDELLTWLADRGRFIRTPERSLYYLWRDRRHLYELDTDAWHAFLHVLSGVNPGAAAFKVLAAVVKTKTLNEGEEVEVVRLAHWDRVTQTLRVSRFDGTVYVLDGQQIREEANGAGPVVFEDMTLWQRYECQASGRGQAQGLARTAPVSAPGDLGNWQNAASGPEMYGWAFQVWLLTLFFTELTPTKPLLLMLGEKGSGKSMLLRLTLRLLFGRWMQISGVPDKPDAFTVAAAHYHLYVIDNGDEAMGSHDWLRDKLARITTGAMDEYRKLYTSKELGVIRYRCWLAMTARTPDILRRDDLADRLLIFPLARIEDDRRETEASFLAAYDDERDAWWTHLLLTLNSVVDRLRARPLDIHSPLRMADWETLGRAISETFGKEHLWNDLVVEMKRAQGEFVADGDIVLEAIDKWLDNPLNASRLVSARELYTETQELLFGIAKPDADWPRSVKGFGRRLANVKDYLVQAYGMQTVMSRKMHQLYQFRRRP